MVIRIYLRHNFPFGSSALTSTRRVVQLLVLEMVGADVAFVILPFPWLDWMFQHYSLHIHGLLIIQHLSRHHDLATPLYFKPPSPKHSKAKQSNQPPNHTNHLFLRLAGYERQPFQPHLESSLFPYKREYRGPASQINALDNLPFRVVEICLE